MKKFRLFLLVTLLFVVSITSCTVFNGNKTDYATITATIRNLNPNRVTTKYGHMKTSIWAPVFHAHGFELGDIVKVEFLDKTLEMPVVSAYDQVESGKPAVIVKEGSVALAINMGNFMETYGIATMTVNDDKTWFWTECDGVSFPFKIKISMAEKAGYLEEYRISNLERTNKRNDYKNLTDEEFANFRKVETTNMKNLYRTSNPVNAELGRNKYADNAIRNAGVTVILNLSDSQADAQSRKEFKNSYYSTCNVKYLNLGADFTSGTFQSSLAEGLRFLSENKGIYAVHCTEGKDRAGFVCAVLECLMGADAEEVSDDYMTTYFNYYGIEKGTFQYERILSANIEKNLQDAFEIEDFRNSDLQQAAEKYLLKIGLSQNEINNLKANL